MADATASRATYLLGDRYQVPPDQLSDGEVTLRRYHINDASDLFAAAEKSLPELTAWMPWAANGYTLADAESFLKTSTGEWVGKKGYNYALVINGEICGSFGLMNPVIGDAGMGMGYWLGTPWTGRGYATRAASLLTQAAFDCGAEAVQIWHDSRNGKSRAIPERLGYRYLGEYNSLEIIEKGPHGVWQIDKTD